MAAEIRDRRGVGEDDTVMTDVEIELELVKIRAASVQEISLDGRDAAIGSGVLALEIIDHLNHETDGPTVLTALGAAAVFNIDRFEVTIERFMASLRQLKAGRDAEIARKKKEN